MQEVSILPLHEWKRAQKKPSLVAANDGLMEEMILYPFLIIISAPY
ncbi:hypothetical protein IMAU10418_02864 [Lactiplantibacillus plantarum]|nr:hypothetical protein [Lactiplantibacillus plantarum]